MAVTFWNWERGGKRMAAVFHGIAPRGIPIAEQQRDYLSRTLEYLPSAYIITSS
jgi:hypothetical protein